MPHYVQGYVTGHARNHPRQGFRRAYHDARGRLEGNARIWLTLLPLTQGKAQDRETGMCRVGAGAAAARCFLALQVLS